MKATATINHSHAYIKVVILDSLPGSQWGSSHIYIHIFPSACLNSFRKRRERERERDEADVLSHPSLFPPSHSACQDRGERCYL